MKINYIISRIENNEDRYLIEKAYLFASKNLSGIKHSSGCLLIDFILEVANVLIDFKADNSTIISCMLYETINNGISEKEIAKEFSTAISHISLNITKITVPRIDIDNENIVINLNELKPESDEDVRALFVKLATRYYSIQNSQNFNEDKKIIASKTMNILVPIASKLRLNYIKAKLEELCFYYSNKEDYENILKKLEATPEQLNSELNDIKKNIANLLIKNGINATIKGRVKNIYSIYNKLSSGKKWEDIYDILALRILIEDSQECYKVVELIHSNYSSLSTRFKDYIANPKENMYQSIHTTILDNKNRYYEIQIRTNEMNKTAETGSASHQLYKQKKNK